MATTWRVATVCGAGDTNRRLQLISCLLVFGSLFSKMRKKTAHVRSQSLETGKFMRTVNITIEVQPEGNDDECNKPQANDGKGSSSVSCTKCLRVSIAVGSCAAVLTKHGGTAYLQAFLCATSIVRLWNWSNEKCICRQISEPWASLSEVQGVGPATFWRQKRTAPMVTAGALFRPQEHTRRNRGAKGTTAPPLFRIFNVIPMGGPPTFTALTPPISGTSCTHSFQQGCKNDKSLIPALVATMVNEIVGPRV